MSATYLEAVRDADTAVGVIMQTIADSRLADSTAIILTSDHGGENRSHDRHRDADSLVPWLCRVPGVPGGRVLHDAPQIADTAPTVLALLGLPPLPDTDGRAINACVPR